jgi:hypothetical protein
METWATFSIVDHRRPTYRQALALFDRIVVPLPPKPIGDQTAEELDQLKAEVDFLASHNAAVAHQWSSETFREWREPFLAEAVAARVNRDVFQDTRLMLAEDLTSSDVQAIPVYGGLDQYAKARNELTDIGEALTVELMQRLPVPDYDTPLENLIHLRNNPAFRTALADLLEWKRLRIPTIFFEANRPSALGAAMRDFDRLTQKYAEEMDSEGYKKVGTVASIFFGVVTGEIAGTIKEGLVSFSEVREPCWKKVSELKCAPGGVVYHFKEALR